MQKKTNHLVTTLSNVGLDIHMMSKILKISPSSNKNLVTLNGSPLEEVMSFTYLSSIIDHSDGTELNVIVKIGKARVVFILLKNIWGSTELFQPTKLTVQPILKAILLYRAETWRTTKAITQRIQSFINMCLIQIL